MIEHGISDPVWGFAVREVTDLLQHFAAMAAIFPERVMAIVAFSAGLPRVTISCFLEQVFCE
ncbi:MAG TPA: hypothetical protein VE135_25630 [Pyrinomonadaceae bacterium]|nr:hypothetical protein [Pyrinomonadaceae bacterium]